MVVGWRRLASGVALAVFLFHLAAGRLVAAETPDLLATLEAFDHPKLGEPVSVSGLRLEGPHASFVLESGRAAPVSAGDRIVGLFFEGRGAFEYLSADSIEAPVVVFNAKKGSSLKPEKTADGVRLQDSFKRLLWLAAGKPLPELSGPSAPPLADAFRKHRDKFGRIHAPPLSHDFAIQRIDAPDAPLIWAELDGGREDLLYVFDGTDDPAEGLATLNSSESNETLLRRYLWLAPLSLQPIGRDPRDPPRPRFLLTDVDVRLQASAGNDAKLTVVETLVPQGRPARALRFDVDSIVYAQAGSNLEERFEKVRRVTDESGRVLPSTTGSTSSSSRSRSRPPRGSRSSSASRSTATSSCGRAATVTGSSGSGPGSPCRRCPGRPTRSAPRCAFPTPSCRSRRERPCGARGGRRTFSRRGSTRRSSSLSSSRAVTTWRRPSATA